MIVTGKLLALAVQGDQFQTAHESERAAVADHLGGLPLVAWQSGPPLPEALAHVHLGVLGEDDGRGLQSPLQGGSQHPSRRRKASFGHKLVDGVARCLNLCSARLRQWRVMQVDIRERSLPRSLDVLLERLARGVAARGRGLLGCPALGIVFLDVVHRLPMTNQPNGLLGDGVLRSLGARVLVVRRALEAELPGVSAVNGAVLGAVPVATGIRRRCGRGASHVPDLLFDAP
mmetsp:Transcript_133637/g.386862  ORF Transcript_133637/g.386862 Transcript_133637/m.386862 type:complete len:231 (-) Transcript_133637:205-897(-)